ncbi:hypothetical protein [Microcoleus sp.]|uniref:hypothetical protein n=1 Tax=Microcoleus sp. TaxID=44472 RepID=UPI003593A2B6
MKNYRIGFGHTKNVGNYQNDRAYIEAELEEWENIEESMDRLRSEVARQLNVRGQLLNLKERIHTREKDLEKLDHQVQMAEQKLERAQRAWENFSEFLTAHGVDPETLTIENFSAMRKLHTGTLGQENTIIYVADDSADLGFGEIDRSDDDYQPYENDNYEGYEENPNNDRIPF